MECVLIVYSTHRVIRKAVDTGTHFRVACPHESPFRHVNRQHRSPSTPRGFLPSIQLSDVSHFSIFISFSQAQVEEERYPKRA